MCACVRVLFKKAEPEFAIAVSRPFCLCVFGGRGENIYNMEGFFLGRKIRVFLGLAFFSDPGYIFRAGFGYSRNAVPVEDGLHSDDLDNKISAWTRGQTRSRCDARETPEPAGADGTGRVGTTSHNPRRVIGEGERTHAEMWYNIVYVDTA